MVVRYFGGIKLGVGGLIGAYKATVADALANAVVEERQITELILVKCGYSTLNGVMKIAKDFDLEIVSQSMTLSCEITLNVRMSLVETVKQKLLEIQGVDFGG
ncbi:MAG: hypothetical protein U5K79_17325 [Cyclobacteriaceae bacterium]|nr:hypothetical protein [Cyclobacteriaceae bacterium]